MPLPNEIYDYNKYLTPDYILEKDVDKKNNGVDSCEDSEESENTFKLII